MISRLKPFFLSFFQTDSPLLKHSNFTALMLIILIVSYLAFRHSDQLFTPTNILEYSQKYAQSQYILGDASPEKINDGVVYIYAGYAYMQGQDPTTINFEHPPLGKYILGLSHLLTGNSVQLNILLFVGTLYTFYLLSARFLDSFGLRLLAVVALSSLSLFNQLLSMALLDIPLLLTLLLFYLTLSWKTPRVVLKYVLIGLILGVMASIKYPFPFIAVPLLILLIGAWFQKEIRWSILSLPIIAGVYLLQYIVYFLHGHSLIDFLRFEAYRFNWWAGDRTAPKFLIFESLFYGRHQAWWEPGTYQYSDGWTPILPGIFLLSIPAAFVMKRQIWPILFFVVSMSMLFLFAVGSASALRYILLLLPIWILTVFSGMERLIQRYNRDNT